MENVNSRDSYTVLLDFLDQLHAADIFYYLRWSRPRMIKVCVDVPGERWEVEFAEDGNIDVEVFASVRGVEGPERLEELFARHSN